MLMLEHKGRKEKSKGSPGNVIGGWSLKLNSCLGWEMMYSVLLGFSVNSIYSKPVISIVGLSLYAPHTLIASGKRKHQSHEAKQFRNRSV